MSRVLTIEDDEITANDIAGKLRKRGFSVWQILCTLQAMKCPGKAAPSAAEQFHSLAL